MTFRVYVPAYPPCSGKAQPGTLNVQRAILQRFDVSENLGVYSCRPIVGGSAPSIHSDGRAGDVGFPRLHWQGYQLVETLRLHAWDLGVMGIIWDRRRWDWRTPWGRSYAGADPHTTHVHWEQEPTLARTLTWPTANRLIGENMSFTSQEEAALKRLAPYGDILTLLGQGLNTPGPTTGKVGNGYSLIHVLETYRVLAANSGIDPTDHQSLARLLGQ